MSSSPSRCDARPDLLRLLRDALEVAGALEAGMTRDEVSAHLEVAIWSVELDQQHNP